MPLMEDEDSKREVCEPVPTGWDGLPLAQDTVHNEKKRPRLIHHDNASTKPRKDITH